VLHKNERPVVEDSIAYDADEWLEKILRILSDEHASTYLVNQAKAAINRLYLPRTHVVEATKTPKGHIPDEECCDACDVRAEIRERLGL
jgi:hypothetical protein